MLDDPRVADELAAAPPGRLGPGHAPTLDDAAYVIYTSGSTGRPKGVVVPHAGITSLVRTAVEGFGVGPASRVLQFASFSFDVTVFELVMALHTGATLVVTPSELRVAGPELLDHLRRHDVTVFAFPPSLVAAFGDLDLPAGGTLLTGTEKVPADVVARWAKELDVVACYGLTEATVNSTLWLPGAGWDGQTVPLGHPDPGTRAYVLDGALQPCAPGVVGELYVGGDGLARGYLGRPDLTAERFVADPYAPEPGARMYRTGDLVAWRPDGELDFLGRADAQVSLRGFRIEPAEVEEALARHPGVERAAVVVREDAPGVKRLVGYVVPRRVAADDPLDPADVRAHCAVVLPDHMVPAAVVVLDDLPRNPAGKLDRSALPAPDLSALTTGVAPRTSREAALARLVADVLGLPSVGVEDDFFLLGGDSITAIQLVSRARGEDVVLTARQVFAERTVAAMAAVARRGGDGDVVLDATGPLVDLADDERDELAAAVPGLVDVVPLAPLQQGLYFLAELGAGGADAYTVVHGVDLVGPLDVPALRAAADALLVRHPNLRAGFRQTDRGTVVSTVGPPVAAPWREVDLRALPEDERERRLARLLAAERRRPVRLDEPPLIRFTLARVADDRHHLALTCHHILVDGWSAPILFRDLLALHAGGVAAEALPPAPPYRAHLAWLASQDPAAATAAWQDALAGLDEPTLVAAPGSGGTAAPTSPTSPDRAELTLDDDVVHALVGLARRRGVTLASVLEAGWGLVVGALTGRDDVVVGATLSGRSPEVPGVEAMVGLLINTVPARVTWRPDEPVGAVLDRLQSWHVELLDHTHVHLAALQRAVTGGGDLFDTLVVVENTPLDEAAVRLAAGGLEIGRVALQDATHYPLSLIAVPGVGADGRTVEALRLRVDRTAPLVADVDAATIATWLRRVLAAMAADDATPVADVSVLGPGERAAAARAATGPARLLPALTLTARLRAQAAATPGAEAVVCGDDRITYAELAVRSRAVASWLRARGVGPESVVGVALPRSVDLMVALVGVLDAGAAYLPLDPELPEARRAFMAADAGATIVLDPHSPIFTADVVAGTTGTPGEIAVVPHPDNAAYVIYTSGSTGAPKGTVVSHRSIGNRLAWMQDTFPIGAGDRVLQKTPIGFDVSVWELFWPLVEGATVVLAEPGGHRDPGHLAEVMRDEGVTTVHFVPSMLEAFLADDRVTDDVTWAAALRHVVSSGEALPPAAVRRWLDLTGVPIHNLYGPTEAAVDVTWWPCDEPPAPGVTSVPIGTPIWNTGTVVLDHHLRVVPVDVPGELYLTGVQLARGYLGRPGLTADRFVADPQGPPGARMYRTGDLVRRRADGALDYLGRTDHQVKIRGNRVELGEIEAALAAVPGVARAVVVARTRPRPRAAAGRVRGAGRRRRRGARSRVAAGRARRPARGAGPGRVRAARRAAADHEREGRPQGAARPDRGGWGERRGRARRLDHGPAAVGGGR